MYISFVYNNNNNNNNDCVIHYTVKSIIATNGDGSLKDFYVPSSSHVHTCIIYSFIPMLSVGALT